MTDRNELNTLKTIAKRYARAHRVPHHVGLDWLANELGYPHWKALTVAWEKGWRPDSSQLETLQNEFEAINSKTRPNILIPIESEGVIDGHPYTTSIASEVFMYGRGWAICVEQAPSEAPEIEVDRRVNENPILDPEFRAKALAIANEAADILRARIARDWPRRSTKPDAEGRVVHPLWANSELSSQWHCLHCDGAFSGKQIAENMWHCPQCSATPIDIFVEPFWKAAS